jgi:hypothetical protein
MTTEEFIPYKFIKLNNGEDIVCMIENNVISETQIKVLHPLRLQLMPKMLTGTQEDAIGLSHWMHPMSEAVSFELSLKDVLLISDASPGLIKYYEYVLTQMRNNGFEDLDNINDDEETYDELFDNLSNSNKLIH